MGTTNSSLGNDISPWLSTVPDAGVEVWMTGASSSTTGSSGTGAFALGSGLLIKLGIVYSAAAGIG